MFTPNDIKVGQVWKHMITEPARRHSYRVTGIDRRMGQVSVQRVDRLEEAAVKVGTLLASYELQR